MKLNVNFNKKIEPLINSSESLSDWFEKNQKMMAYFEMTYPGCSHFEVANYDVKVLCRMASDALTWLETDSPYSDEEKVNNAIISIASIYDSAKERLSDVAKRKYYIDVESLEEKQTTGMHL